MRGFVVLIVILVLGSSFGAPVYAQKQTHGVIDNTKIDPPRKKGAQSGNRHHERKKHNRGPSSPAASSAALALSYEKSHGVDASFLRDGEVRTIHTSKGEVTCRGGNNLPYGGGAGSGTGNRPRRCAFGSEPPAD